MPKEIAPVWTPVALSSDLPVASVIPARLATAALAIWRAQSGTVSAVADRCPHRGMRLSHGFVRGEALSCIYHGWRYGKSGKCLAIPAHPSLTPPDAIRVATYRAGERDGVIWVTADENTADMPSNDGLTALRSIALSTTAETLAACIGTDLGENAIDWAIDGMKARLLIAPSGEDGMLLLHLLIESGASQAQKIAASNALEVLRRQAESAASRGEAA
ncbi:Rieske (2Fe-2S) protein [Agrobacterium sp. SORGH_AS 787]|uniref:Rieske (2Fe-2S) protein n=1 Tax=Agrobacterium sp. SORGH_AS 787 TaxID=3041775 RepID=UPI00278131E2|nr:nitrite reductase/ring-hydroxylating ferredoxin subunit [Rhizobium sp. SORGH_AS_0787]